MKFYFLKIGFWKLAIVALTAEVTHLLIQMRWSEIRGSRTGPRSPAATIFMGGEAALVLISLATGIGTLAHAPPAGGRPGRNIFRVILGMTAIVAVLILVWSV